MLGIRSADTIMLQPVADFFGSSVITVYASDEKDVTVLHLL